VFRSEEVTKQRTLASQLKLRSARAEGRGKAGEADGPEKSTSLTPHWCGNQAGNPTGLPGT